MKYKEYNDNELISYIREENEEANEIIFNKYMPLVLKVAKNAYAKKSNTGFELNDFVQEAMIGLSYAITTYNENKQASFYTYAKVCMERKLVSLIRETERLKHKYLNESISYENTTDEFSFAEILGDNNMNPENMMLEDEYRKELYSKAKKILTDLEYKVFSLKMGGLDYKEIAKLLDKTPKDISNTLTRIKIKIKNKILAR